MLSRRDPFATCGSAQRQQRSLVTLGDDGLAVLIEAFEVPEIVRTATEAFAKADSAAVPLLVKVLKHQQPDLRASAADALGHMGIAASDAVADLIALLRDQDRQVRYRVVRALHELGPKAKPAVPVLTEIIFNAKESEAIRQLGDQDADRDTSGNA